MFDEGRLTIRVVRLHNAPHDAPHDGPHNSFKEHFLQRNNDVLHRCHIWCQRTAGATTHFPTLFATHQQVINKVMIEHTSNEIFTFCTHVGNDISTPVPPVDLRFHYSAAKCQYFVIFVAFDADVLRIATPAGNPVAWALQEIPLHGSSRKSHCLGPARRNSQHDSMKWIRYNEILAFCTRVIKSALDWSRNMVSDLHAKC